VCKITNGSIVWGPRPSHATWRINHTLATMPEYFTMRPRRIRARSTELARLLNYLRRRGG